jgi:hypothetical protein
VYRIGRELASSRPGEWEIHENLVCPETVPFYYPYLHPYRHLLHTRLLPVRISRRTVLPARFYTREWLVQSIWSTLLHTLDGALLEQGEVNPVYFFL